MGTRTSILFKDIEMKKIELNFLLRTAVLTASLAAIMGVSACSSEKEDANTQSGDAMGTTQGPEVEDTASQGGMPSPTNDTSAGAATDSSAASSDGTATTNQPESADGMVDAESDNKTAENPNLDKTAADGVQ